jgi:hypothetical protein
MDQNGMAPVEPYAQLIMSRKKKMPKLTPGKARAV